MVTADDGEATLGWMLDESHEMAPEDLPALVAAGAKRMGSADAQLYLADIDQRELIPVSPPGGEQLPVLDIDSTLAGRAFQTSEHAGPDGDDHVWFPIRNGTDRLGVVRLTFDRFDETMAARARHLAALTSDLIVAKSKYSDLFHRVRRRETVVIAAELQRELLPPLTFLSPQVSVAGILEPAYEVAGDAFDYAFDGGILSAAVFDGVGHDLSSSVMTALAVGTYRHARRRGLDLTATATEIDGALRSQFRDQSFVTAALVQLDAATGQVRWLNAGHPRPLLLRAGRVVRTLACTPRPPLGLPRAAAPMIGTEQLEPGDALLLFTDGVVEARSAAGRAFGFDRLAEFLQRAAASGFSPPETMRRLVHDVVDHHDGRLQDDATCVLVEWRSR